MLLRNFCCSRRVRPQQILNKFIGHTNCGGPAALLHYKPPQQDDLFVAAATSSCAGGGLAPSAPTNTIAQTPPKNARVVICGGGIMGAAVAYHLALAGWGPHTLILEQGK